MITVLKKVDFIDRGNVLPNYSVNSLIEEAVLEIIKDAGREPINYNYGYDGKDFVNGQLTVWVKFND
jgi:hypothetical protein